MTEIDEGLFNEFWDIYNDATDKGFAQGLPLVGGDLSRIIHEEHFPFSLPLFSSVG